MRILHFTNVSAAGGLPYALEQLITEHRGPLEVVDSISHSIQAQGLYDIVIVLHRV